MGVAKTFRDVPRGTVLWDVPRGTRELDRPRSALYTGDDIAEGALPNVASDGIRVGQAEWVRSVPGSVTVAQEILALFVQVRILAG